MVKETLSIEETLAALRKLGLADRMLEKPYPKMFPDEPFMYGIKVEPFGHGYDFFSKERASWRAIGENTERTCRRKVREYIYPRTFISSYKKLAAKALNPHALAGFTDEQKNSLRLKYQDTDLIRWVTGASVLTNRATYVPYQLIDTEYSELSDEPLLRWGVSTGLATGNTPEEALCKGMLEIIERDAFMINYLNHLPSHPIDLEYCATIDEDISQIYTRIKKAGIDPNVTLLATDFPLYVGLGILTDKRSTRPRVSIGARASFSLKTVIIDSLTEALAVRLHQRTLFDTHKLVSPFKRLDRLMYWAYKENVSSISFFLKGGKNKPSSEALCQATIPYQKQLSIIKNHIIKSNYTAYFISITTPQIEKEVGLYSVLAIIPELQPIHLDESFPCRGGSRLYTIPKKLHFTTSGALNYEPSPFV